MSRFTRRGVGGLGLIAACVLALGGVAAAHGGDPDGGVTAADAARHADQHGTTAGHLSPEGTSSNVDLVSKLKLKNVVPEKIADVGGLERIRVSRVLGCCDLQIQRG